CQQYNDLVFAF
nr:immunoglobulin light chain junction region [Macaca mulatta]